MSDEELIVWGGGVHRNGGLREERDESVCGLMWYGCLSS